jgi:hypothetical protein
LLDPVLLPNGRSAAAGMELTSINKGNSLWDSADELLIRSSDPMEICTKLDCDISKISYLQKTTKRWKKKTTTTRRGVCDSIDIMQYALHNGCMFGMFIILDAE